MIFERGNTTAESLNIGRKALAQEIDLMYKAGAPYRSLADGKMIQELTIIDPRNIPLHIKAIIRGEEISSNYCFDIPEQPEHEGNRPLKFFKDYRGKWLKYKGEYFRIPCNLREE